MAASSETKLTNSFQVKLKKRGAYTVKIRGGPGQTRGLPDLTVVYRGYTLFIEVKMPGKKKNLSDIQAHTIKAIKEAGGIAFVADKWEDIEKWLDWIDKVRDA